MKNKTPVQKRQIPKLAPRPIIIPNPDTCTPVSETVNNNKGTMSPPKPSQTTTASPEYLNTAEAQKCNLKPKCMKMVEVLKKEMNE